jgi:tRNA uracil 4-sulfurtransferase
MKYLIKFFPEIAIKSRAVRRQLTSTLKRNIKYSLSEIDETINVVSYWDHLEVFSDNNDPLIKFKTEKRLKEVPGIEAYYEVSSSPYTDFESIYLAVKEYYQNIIDGKRFASRTKRDPKVDFKSMDLDRYIGQRILEDFPNTKVDLTKPEITISLTVKPNDCYILGPKIQGVSGSPVSSQEKVLSLISGGFDSGVASYKMIKKGCKVDYLFFNLGGYAHEIGVKEVSKYIAKTYSSGYKSTFISVNFEEIVKELLTNIHHRYRGILLKRMMFRVAEILLKEHNYYGFVTGESIGQVSSQTLVNLNVISQVTNQLILRPLLTMDKREIITISEQIGTDDFAKNMPEYCAVVSEKPATAAKLEDVLAEEEKFNYELLEKAIKDRNEISIKEFEVDSSLEDQIEITSFIEKDEVIIDIRDEEKMVKNPDILKDYSHIQIPFFSLYQQFAKLDKSKNYLLYCDKGTTSRLMAINLKEQGYSNIKVFKIPENSCKISN